MSKRGGAWAAAWALGASLAGPVVWAVDTATARVTIRLDDLAGTPAHDLEAAKSEMSRVFHAAGVDVHWIDTTATPRPGELTLILLKHNAEQAGERGDVAGQAFRAVSRAYVYCDQLDTVTKRLPVDANMILGRVMAHEVGHLLLPPNSHSRIGIMRPHVDFGQVGVNTFTSDQVEALRGAIGRPR